MAIRLVASEYEARLVSADEHDGSGKIERKAYKDGTTALRARFRATAGTAGTLELFINEQSIGFLEGTGKKAELELESAKGDVVPAVRVGDTAEIWAGAELVATGQFVED